MNESAKICAYWNCTNEATGRSKYCSKNCKMTAIVSIRRKELKMLAIEHLGGKCVRCGYDKCIDAFEFHHRDPSQKDFSISKYGHTFALSRVKSEIDKCDLLCANCHREVHFQIGSGMTILSEVLEKRKRAET